MINALAVITAIAALILYKYVRKTFFQRLPISLPPGPKGRMLLGNVGDLPGKGEAECLHWAKHKERYGPISCLTVLGQKIMIISDYRTAQKLLDKRGSVYSDRPFLHFSGEMIGWKESVILMMYSERFRTYRTYMRQLIGTKVAVSRFHHLQENEIRKFLLRIFEDPSELYEHTHTTTGSIVAMINYGYTTEPKEPDPLIKLTREATAYFSLASTPGKWLVDTIPLIQNLPEWLPGMGFKRTAARWKQTVRELTERSYKFAKLQFENGKAMPSLVSDHLGNGPITAEEEHDIKYSALSLQAGGTETTAFSIYSFFFAMTLHPDVVKRAQEEIDGVVGRDRLPSFKDREFLPYTDAVVKEVFRWYPIVPMGFPHVASDDDVYEGMFIPKGSILMPNIWLFLHDEANYKNPHAFKPERFLGQSPEMDPRILNFGFGRRVCPGRELADETMFLIIATSLAVFDISGARYSKLERNLADPSISLKPGVLSCPDPFQCNIKPKDTKAEFLLRAIEKEDPWEESDARAFMDLEWE